MKEILNTSTHVIEVADHTRPTKEYLEREWRDSELKRTDEMLQDDRPNYNEILAYRVALGGYPNSEGFPNGERPSI